MVRRFNPATGADPYHSLQVADIGDVGINLYDLKDSCRRIREAYQRIMAGGCIPLTLGKPSRRRVVGLACAKQRGSASCPSLPSSGGQFNRYLPQERKGLLFTCCFWILQAETTR